MRLPQVRAEVQLASTYRIVALINRMCKRSKILRADSQALSSTHGKSIKRQ
jgi:hypothetical protein